MDLLIVLPLLGVVVFLQLFIIYRSYTTNSKGTEGKLLSIEKAVEQLSRSVSDQMYKNREEANSNARQGREELTHILTNVSNTLMVRQTEMSNLLSDQVSKLTLSNEQRMDKMRSLVEDRLKYLQEDNAKKLEQMRMTVDEKLHATLEQRLGESFKLVSDRLELVHKGLGEMQTLASGVGDLKKVLTNVKTRGILGETQLHSILDQILTTEQYATNVPTKAGSNDRVEFAIKLPGKNKDSVVWLPIDAKFPLEDYQRLVDAQDKYVPELIEQYGKALEQRLKSEAKTIKDKYIDVPGTTPFALLFLPIEGLYAEVLRRPGLVEMLQHDYQVIATGPTTISAILNSLQMGFRTLAIEKRSSEVWALLGAVKTEFGKFGQLLDKTQKQLHQISDTLDSASRKSRTIERKLKGVQELPVEEAANLLSSLEDTETENIS